jgi:hypothetical protein
MMAGRGEAAPNLSTRAERAKGQMARWRRPSVRQGGEAHIGIQGMPRIPMLLSIEAKPLNRKNCMRQMHASVVSPKSVCHARL